MAAGVADGALIVDTKIDNTGARRGGAEFKQQIDGLRSAVDRAGREMANGANGYIRAMNQARTAARGATTDQAALTKEIANTEAAITRLEQKQELARRKFEAAREAAEEKAAQDFTEKYGTGPEALPWEDELEAAEQYAEMLNQAIKDASDSFGEFEDTTAFRNTSVEIEMLTEKLEALKAQLAGMQGEQSGAADKAGEQAEDAADQASNGWRAFGEVVGQAAGQVVKLAGTAAHAGASIARIAGGGALAFLRKLAEGARNAAIQLAKLSGRAITGGFKTLGQGILTAGRWMLGLNRSSNQANGGFKRGLMTILKYGLGIRSLYFLFRKLRTAITDSFTELAKHDAKTNSSINSLRTALAGLKGSLATAFSPIFNAVAPALTYLINMLTAAINAIGAFMAALTGQRTYQKAVAGISAAGGAASNAGGAASNAADEFKDLKRELAGFDELDILGSKDTSSSGSGSGGGGGGGGGGGFSYETEEIGSGITDFVAKLKEMWANADYEGIGAEIAGAINRAFEKAKELISWENLGDKITEAVNAITGIFNGLVDKIDWTLIGETFGEGINTIIRTVNLLLTGINWENLGKGFADGLNGLVSTVSWGELGQMFANKLNALIGTIKGLVSNFAWGDAGTAFATTVNGLLSSVSWNDLATAATTGINGIVSALRLAVNSFDWGYAAGAFTKFLNNLISGFDFDGLAKLATDGINKIISSLRIAVNEFDWGYAAGAFTKFLNNLISGFDFDELAKLATDGINKIVSSLRVAVSGFDWSYAATTFANTVNGLLSGIGWDELATTATDSVNKIIAALRTTINGFDWSYAGTNFASTVNKLFEGFDWENLGKLVADGIAKPLSALRLAVAGFDWSYAAKSFADTVNAFFSNEQLWADAGTIISDAIKGLFTWGADFLNKLDTVQIANDVKAALANIDWPGIARKIWDLLVAAFRALGNFVYELLFPKEATDRAAEAFIEDMNVALGKSNLNFGLDPTFVPDQEKIEQLQAAISMSLAQGKWTEVPITLTIPEESITKAKEQFVNRWNELHPESPVWLNPETGEVEKVKQELQDNPIEATVTPTIDEDDWQKEWDSVVGDELDVQARVGLLKNGWTSISTFVGTVVDVFTNLKKNGWSTISAFVGTAVSVATSLTKHGWSSISGFVGTAVGVAISLSKHGWSSIAGYVGTAVSVATSLTKKGWSSIAGFVGTSVAVEAKLKAKNKTSDVFSTKLDVSGDLTKNSADRIRAAATKAMKGIQVTVKAKGSGGGAKLETKHRGGAITSGGRQIAFAGGGVIRGGLARFIQNVPHYAGGTTSAHGTIFVAGEAGPEIMGHINGRTEILNRSQLAQTMYAAVVAGMSQAIGSLGTFLSGQLADCTNAITATVGAVSDRLGGLSALAGIQYHAPAMASGTVLPYEVAAQVARSSADIQNTLDANNEDLIQTIISVIGAQTSAIVAALRANQQGGGTADGLTAQQLINDINRRTQMFGGSPLLS